MHDTTMARKTRASAGCKIIWYLSFVLSQNSQKRFYDRQITPRKSAAPIRSYFVVKKKGVCVIGGEK